LGLFSNDFAAFNYSLSGGLIGGTFGAQIQSGHVVMGLEGDIDWTSMSGSGTGSVVKLGVLQGTATIASKVSVIDTLRTRVARMRLRRPVVSLSSFDDRQCCLRRVSRNGRSNFTLSHHGRRRVAGSRKA
jgi:hypothetical protein